MYVFPFTHTFNKQDLQNIWQNLPPAIARDSYNRPGDGIEQEVTLAHSLFGTPLYKHMFPGRTEEIRWMVFKVKKSAQKNYFKKLEIDRLPITHPERELEEKSITF